MKQAIVLSCKHIAIVPSVSCSPSSHPWLDTETGQDQAPGVNESSSLLRTGNEAKTTVERKGTVVKAALYAIQVFYSFFIM